MAFTRTRRILSNSRFLALINANLPSATNPFATMADVIASGFSLPYVTNYTALTLIDPSTVPNEIYNVLNGENGSWRPAWLGGTYYPKGIYQSIAGVWEYVGDFPYQATQAEVDAGINNDKFVTPLTLANYSGLDVYYKENFTSALLVTIPQATHGISRVPDITIYDSLGQKMFAKEVVNEITFDVTLTFNRARTGFVILT